MTPRSKEITLLLVEKLQSQNVQIFEVGKDMQNLPLEVPEEVLSK